MTKSQEIALLETIVNQYGKNSYIGSWLAGNRDSIIQDIQSDFEPLCLLPHQADREARQIIANAKKEASAIISAAEQKRVEITNGAYAKVEQIKDEARNALARAMHNI